MFAYKNHKQNLRSFLALLLTLKCLSDGDTYLQLAGERHELMRACAANGKHNEVWNR